MAGLHQKALNIQADSVSDIIGARSLAYVAIKKAALDEDPSMQKWAEMMFNQISSANRRRIKNTAEDKAHEERRVYRAQRREKTVEVANMTKIFGVLAGAD
jgi:hypothetical protein